MIHEIETENFDEEWNDELILDGLSSDEHSSDEDRVAAQIRRESQGQRKNGRKREAWGAAQLPGSVADVVEQHVHSVPPWLRILLAHYSVRSACMGSIEAARRAGK